MMANIVICLFFYCLGSCNESFQIHDIHIEFYFNYNKIPPAEALREYRKKFNTYTKLIVIATSANKFTIADPSDIYGMLDIAGFSADTPGIIADFVSQNIS